MRLRKRRAGLEKCASSPRLRSGIFVFLLLFCFSRWIGARKRRRREESRINDVVFREKLVPGQKRKRKHDGPESDTRLGKDKQESRV